MNKNHYGDAGSFYIPNVGVKVPIYNKKNLSNPQLTVDAENSGVLCKNWKGGHCDYVADHAAQGFNKIKQCHPDMLAFIVTENSTQYYSCVAITKGTNTKKELITLGGQKLSNIKWADLCAYCCNDETGRDITMVFFKKGVKVNKNIFKAAYAE